jgi:hypothetical protein
MENSTSFFDYIMRSGVFPVTVGFLLGLIPEMISKRAKKNKALAALECEIRYCATLAKRRLEKDASNKHGAVEDILPLRYPVLAFQNSFPTLLDSGRSTNTEEIYAITDYYCHIIALNNSLNLLESGSYDAKNSEVLRQTIKGLLQKCSVDDYNVQKLLKSLKKL